MGRRNSGNETWHRMSEWDKGQTSAERLAAQILIYEGYQNIDPSHPLGGKDGKKDISFLYNGEKWIAGVYFPRGPKKFNEIKAKFLTDFAGVSPNQAAGFVFITNQELTLGERDTLRDIASEVDVEIYHLERLATILNTPVNYGVRLEFLDIDMTKEEQISFFASQKALTSPQATPLLTLMGMDEGGLSKELVSYQKRSLGMPKIESIKEEITSLYEEISHILCFPEVEPDDLYSQLNIDLPESYLRMTEKLKNLNPVTDASIEPIVVDAITDYCMSNGLEITDAFFVIGKLKFSTMTYGLPYSNRTSLKGSDEEIQKYRQIYALYQRIVEHNERAEFCESLRQKFFAICLVCNTGTTYDEDIDVKLFVPTNCLCKPSSIPVPGHSFIDVINKYSAVDELFVMPPHADVENYTHFTIPLTPLTAFGYPSDSLAGILPQKSSAQKYTEAKIEYRNRIDYVFCYQLFETSEYDILQFNIRYLKQNTNMSIPSVLVFDRLPAYIDYEIRSKHSPNVTKGRIHIRSQASKG